MDLHGEIPPGEDDEDDDREDVGDVAPGGAGIGEAFSGACFPVEIVPAPAAFPRAESKEDQTSHGEEVVAHDEVFQGEDIGAFAEGMDVRPDIEAEDAREDEHGKEERDGDGGPLPAPSAVVHVPCHDVFNDGNDRREGGKAHKEEEKTSPEAASFHTVEYVGQCRSWRMPGK